MRRIIIVVIVVLVFSAGFITSSIFQASSTQNSNSAIKASDSEVSDLLVNNPGVSSVTVRGKVITVNDKVIVVEKDSKQLTIKVDDKSTFAEKFDEKNPDAKPLEIQNIKKIPLGSEIVGSVDIRRDSKSGSNLFATHFWIENK